MKLTQLIPLLSIMALTTASCSTIRSFIDQKKPSKAVAPTEVVAVADADAVTPATDKSAALAGEWSIIEVNGEEVIVNGEDHPKLTLTPSDSDANIINIIAFNGCNYLNGVWNVRDNKLVKGGEFISTLKACPDARYEYAVNNALNNTEAFEITDPTNVSLNSATGQTVMKLRKRNLAFLNGAWRVTSIEEQEISARIMIVIDVDENRVHGNAGCNMLNGEIVVNLDKGNGIEFKNLATSRMMCPDIATEQTFLLALENVDTADKGANDNEAVLKNTAGQVIITLTRLTPEELSEMDE